MTQVSVTQARQNFSEIVEKVYLRGESFLLTRSGLPIAKIVPVTKAVLKRYGL